MRKRSIVFGFSLLLSAAVFAASADRQKGGAEKEVRHVLLISVDGLHALDVAGAIKDRHARIGAFVLFAAVVLQMGLGIATLVWVVPLWLWLLHQAGAMLVLTIASVHAAFVRRQRREVARSACSPL